MAEKTFYDILTKLDRIDEKQTKILEKYENFEKHINVLEQKINGLQNDFNEHKNSDNQRILEISKQLNSHKWGLFALAFLIFIIFANMK